MAFNQIVGSGIGLVPIFGDIGLTIWKANSRNAALLEEFLIQRVKQSTTAGQGETAIGQTVVDTTKISGKTGDVRGGGTSTPATTTSTTTALTAPNLNQAPKKNYGWGKDGAANGNVASTAPSTTAAPIKR